MEPLTWPFARSNSSSLRPPSRMSASSRRSRPMTSSRASGRAPRVAREQPGLRVLSVVAVDRVGEPALLPHLLEQARRHAAPERGVHDQEREALGIAAREAVRAEADVRLLGLAALDQVAPRGIRRVLGGPQVPPRRPSGLELAPRRHAATEHPEQILVAEVAGRRHDEVPRHVVGRGRSAPPRRACAALIVADGAQDGAPKRVFGPQRLA